MGSDEMWENKHHKRMADRSVGREHLIKAFKRHRKLHHEKERLHREFHEKVNELFIEERDIQRYHRRIKYSRPMIMLFNLILWFVLFHYFGIKGLSIIFAIIISVTGVTEFIFLMNLEKRIFKPISRLRAGVEEISKGNYDVTVEYGVPNEISVLTRSFNEMAQKLKAAEQLKEQYEENRKNLVANISHDLKTPITTIHGYIETMLDREDISRENVNKYHRIIYNNATYINKLIDDLFLFSKLDMQKLELKLEHISMKAFMEDLMGEFKFELEDRGIGFEYIDEMTQDKLLIWTGNE
jgi:signal transduction histidine kinase